MAQLMPLPLAVSCFSEIQTGFTFLVPANPGSPGQRAVKRVCGSVCVCVCVCLSVYSDVPVTVSRCLCINRATPAGPQLRRARRQRTGTFTAAAITRETPHTKSPVARNKSRVKRSRVARGSGAWHRPVHFTAGIYSSPEFADVQSI